MKEKRFAANVNRDQIARCSELGLTVEEFLALSLASMQHVAGDLGL
jgi:predicted hydrolase (HD superfamily)